MLFEHIEKLVQYGIDTGLTPECERIYTRNLLRKVFCLLKNLCHLFYLIKPFMKHKNMYC